MSGVAQHVDVEELGQVVWSPLIVSLSELCPNGGTFPLDNPPLFTLCPSRPDGPDHLLQGDWRGHAVHYGSGVGRRQKILHLRQYSFFMSSSHMCILLSGWYKSLQIQSQNSPKYQLFTLIITVQLHTHYSYLWFLFAVFIITLKPWGPERGPGYEMLDFISILDFNSPFIPLQL